MYLRQRRRLAEPSHTAHSVADRVQRKLLLIKNAIAGYTSSALRSLNNIRMPRALLKIFILIIAWFYLSYRVLQKISFGSPKMKSQ